LRYYGLSIKFEEAGIPDIVAAMQGQEFQAAYSLDVISYYIIDISND
jgi:hypothetical protein